MQSRSGPPNLQVLVVEDDASARSVLMALVKTFRVDVRGAEDGDEAYHLVLDREPDLILCDRALPVLDGFGFIRRLRRDPRFRRILTIAVSELARPVDIAMMRKAGFDGHIAKPVTPEVLARLLDRAMDLQNARNQGQGA